MDGNCLEFTAIRGVQAGTAYYVIMVPLSVVARLFKFDDESMPAELRAQRILNKARVPAIASYITSNPSEYILSSLCASVDGEIHFEPAGSEGPLRKVGQLQIDMGATILINDGQHRRAAIEEALRERPTMGNETISVVIFADRGLMRSQQMFADLNIHAVRPNRSIKLLYDHRNDLAALSREVINEVPLFRDFTCFEQSSLSHRSSKFFTLSSLHQAIGELLGKGKSDDVNAKDGELAVEFWTTVIDAMPDWQRVARREALTSELRRDYIHAHGVAVLAIAAAGRQLVETYPTTWKARIPKLTTINWARANRELWDNRVLVAGKVNRSKNNIRLVANVVVEALGMPLTGEGRRVEDLYAPPLKVAS